MAVLVDDSAETVLPVYREAFDLVGFKRLGSCPQRCCGGERSVGAVLVVVPLVRTQRVPQMGLIPDQSAVQQFDAKGLSPQRSMIAFMRGIRATVVRRGAGSMPGCRRI
jgi:hypothetical protein